MLIRSQVVVKILRDMAIKRTSPGINYEEFCEKVESAKLIQGQQTTPMNLRLSLLESFLGDKSTVEQSGAWKFAPGTLTIVDLSCPFVDENAACALFTICLQLFLASRRNQVHCIVALDEAHKVRSALCPAVVD